MNKQQAIQKVVSTVLSYHSIIFLLFDVTGRMEECRMDSNQKRATHLHFAGQLLRSFAVDGVLVSRTEHLATAYTSTQSCRLGTFATPSMFRPPNGWVFLADKDV